MKTKSLTDEFVTLTAKECSSLEAAVKAEKLHEGETFDGLLESSLKRMLENKIAMIANAWKKVCPPLFDLTETSKLPVNQLNVIMPYSFADGKSLYLYGDSGRCKTRLMFLKAAMEFAKSEGTLKVHYIHSAEFCIVANNAMYRMEAVNKMYESAKNADLLLVDDIFKGKINESQEMVIFGITDQRQADMKPTIYTSNVGFLEIHKSFTDDGKGKRAEQIVRRLGDVCKFVQFK